MIPSRVYADFHNLDDQNRIRLTCAGTKDDLARLGIDLKDGMLITFYMDDADDAGRADELCVEGVVQYDESEACWVASVKWSAVRHASDERQTAPLRADGPLQSLPELTKHGS